MVVRASSAAPRTDVGPSLRLFDRVFSQRLWGCLPKTLCKAQSLELSGIFGESKGDPGSNGRRRIKLLSEVGHFLRNRPLKRAATDSDRGKRNDSNSMTATTSLSLVVFGAFHDARWHRS